MQIPVTRPRRWSVLLAALGAVLVVVSLCIGCLSLSIITDPTVTSDPDSSGRQSWFLCLLCFGVPALLAGLAALFFAFRRQKQERTLALQSMVLNLAIQQGGSVTAQELALRSNLSLDAAQDLLEEWAVRGICRMELDPAGFTRFWFDSSPPSPGSTV